MQPKANIDTPNLASLAWSGGDIIVSGWVLETTQKLVAKFDNYYYSEIQLNIERRDVAEAFGIENFNCGFHFVLPLNQASGIHRISIHSGADEVTLATTDFVILNPLERGNGSTEITPITVTSFGRSGSTSVMRNLLSLGSILGHDLYPYETRIGQYYLNIFRILQTMPSGIYNESDVLEFSGNIASSPYGFFEKVRQSQLYSQQLDMDFIRERIRLDYEVISGNKGEFFAEKTSPFSIPLFQYIFPSSKHIYLTRDVFSLAASVKEFAKKAAVPAGFGYTGKFTDFLNGSFRNGLIKLYSSIRSNPNCFVLPYLHLINDPESVATFLGNYLFQSHNIHIKTEYQDDLLKSFRSKDLIREHMTSNSLTGSLIGWQSILDQEEKDVCKVIDSELKKEYPVEVAATKCYVKSV